MLLSKGSAQLCLINKLLTTTPAVIQIKCFSVQEIGKRYPKVFDYKNKNYNTFNSIIDTQTVQRLGENSLIITVDGNFGSGKSEFAKKLAKDIDFIYASEIDLDKSLYIRKDNGENLREFINSVVGEKELYRCNTVEEWHENPMFKRSAQVQRAFYKARWQQYRCALLSLFANGQGIVLERSPFSDGVIAQSLYDEEFVSKEFYNYYKNDYVAQTICELWKPHVSIYLDRTPENCLQSIAKTGKEFEKKSKVYTPKFLKTVEKNYKSYLNSLKDDICVLSYDNNSEIIIEDVIDDLESFDFDQIHRFKDWTVKNASEVDKYRLRLSNDVYVEKIFTFIYGDINVPELLLYGEEYVELLEDRKSVV